MSIARQARRSLFSALVASGLPLTEAARLCGVSERTAVRWHGQPDVRVQIQRRVDELTKRIANHLPELMLESHCDG